MSGKNDDIGAGEPGMSDKRRDNGGSGGPADGGKQRDASKRDDAATAGDTTRDDMVAPDEAAGNGPTAAGPSASGETPDPGDAGESAKPDDTDESAKPDDTDAPADATRPLIVSAETAAGKTGPETTADETTADETAEQDDSATAGDPATPDGEAGSKDAPKPHLMPPGESAADDPAATVADGGVPAVPAAKAAPDGKNNRPNRGGRYARRAAYVLGVLVLLPIIGFVIVYLMTPIPNSTQPAAKAQQSVFYYSDNKTVIARSGSFDRRPVQLKEVPGQVRDAVISAENRSFYSDSGVSMRGSARAVWATLTGGSMQGGSTITQQMVRNYYSGLSQQRTAGRKLKEIMIALKVSREKDKSWILQQYLNTIYFGRDAYGIESAAQAYYNKDVGNLTAAEGAYLAAAIQVPSYAGDLSINGAQAYMQARWRYVVNGMVQMRTISPQQAATMKFPSPERQKHKSIFAGDKGYMVSQAKAELRRMGYTDNQINMGGLKVRTTFDKNLMDDAKQAVEGNIPAGTSTKVMTGLVSIDPSTGEINAFYGGKDYLDQAFNTAFDAKVQAGSGFKPYVLAAALDDGESLNTYVDGSSPQTFAGTEIQNDRDENFGEVNLVTATQDSINTAYINLGQKVGLDKVITTAEKAGIPAAQLEPHKDAATLPLGVADVSVEQQAAGYATFASEGVYHAPHVLKSVTDRDGKVQKPAETGKRAFSTTVARDATYAMQKVVDDGTGVNAGLPDRNAAGKTGTTSSGKQLWFNGFIPQMAASVGIFRSDNKPLTISGYSAYGGDLPAKIWRSYMVEADQDLPVKSFGSPSVYTGGSGRPTFGPVLPRPHPTSTLGRPIPRPIPPTHRPPPTPPTVPPPVPPQPVPPPTGAPVRNQSDGYPDMPG
ncbi:MAG: glycosyl transferase family 51 [Actinoallomurus sp.]|nr:glycosyl transferase family 51 [Actinoallomurus sp.]